VDDIPLFDKILADPSHIKAALFEYLPTHLFSMDGLPDSVQLIMIYPGSHPTPAPELPCAFITNDLDRILRFTGYLNRQQRHCSPCYAFAVPELLDLSERSQLDLSAHIHSILAANPPPNRLQRAYYDNILSKISLATYLCSDRLDDLDSAIWRAEKAITETRNFQMENLALAVLLCYALYRRFYIKRNLRDLFRLVGHLSAIDNLHWDCRNLSLTQGP